MLKQTPLSSPRLCRTFVSSLWQEQSSCIASLLQANRRSFLFAAASSRLQSSLHTPRRSNSHLRCNDRRIVDPSLRQRRPLVNGEPVAFHVQDLLPPTPPVTGSNSDLLLSEQQHKLEQQKEILRKREYESDLVVVLDMDECLIHSQFLSNPTMAQVLAHQLQSRRRNNRTTSSSSGESCSSGPSQVEYVRVQLPDGGDLVHVNIRPGLRDFLEAITSRYETHIFTAGVPVYANPVLDQFDPDRTKFAARWFRHNCTWDGECNAYVKNLNALPLPNMARTVLIDNNPLSFLSNPSNGILVPSFYHDPNDDALIAVRKLLLELEVHNDIRPALEDRFGLKQALAKILAQQESAAAGDQF